MTKNFRARIEQLKAFKLAHGTVDVNKNYAGDLTLYKWCGTQRMRFRKGHLTDEMVKELLDLGFNFTPRMYGTVEDVAERMAVLAKFREETGEVAPKKTSKIPVYAALAQWIERMRRYHAGGQLPAEIEAALTNAGIRMTIEVSSRTSANGRVTENKAFERNIAVLAQCLSNMEDVGQPRNLAYRNIKLSKDAQKAYRFIEHLVLKARQGVLADEHRARITMLAFSVNGKPIDQVLAPAPSQASPEGVMLTRAQAVARAAQREIDDAHNRVEEAKQHAREAVARADKIAVSMMDEISAVANATAMAKAEMKTKSGEEYLTTEELAARIKYDPRTIRDHLVGRVLQEGVHFVRPFGGRKMLFLWSRIERDMLQQ